MVTDAARKYNRRYMSEIKSLLGICTRLSSLDHVRRDRQGSNHMMYLGVCRLLPPCPRCVSATESVAQTLICGDYLNARSRSQDHLDAAQIIEWGKFIITELSIVVFFLMPWHFHLSPHIFLLQVGLTLAEQRQDSAADLIPAMRT